MLKLSEPTETKPNVVVEQIFSLMSAVEKELTAGAEHCCTCKCKHLYQHRHTSKLTNPSTHTHTHIFYFTMSK